MKQLTLSNLFTFVISDIISYIDKYSLLYRQVVKYKNPTGYIENHLYNHSLFETWLSNNPINTEYHFEKEYGLHKLRAMQLTHLTCNDLCSWSLKRK